MYNLQMTKYYNVESIIHDINPVYKIIYILLFTFLVLFSSNVLSLVVLLLFIVSLIYVSSVPYNLYFNNLKLLFPIVLFIFIINLIFLVSINNTVVSILKLILFVLYSSLILYTTKPNDLTYGLEVFFSPLKLFGVKVSSLALTISLAMRFIPTIFNEASIVLKSQISRGLNFEGTLIDKCNKLISIVLPIFTLSLKRSDEISHVLDMRLYKIDGKRTRYKKKTYNIVDENILVFHILLVIIVLILEVIL